MGKHFSGAKKNKIAKGLKRIRMQETSEVTKGIRKIRCVDDRPMLARCRWLHHSDYSSEESLGSLSPDEEYYKGHLAFDSLLKAFSSSSQSLSDAYKMRQREQEVASRSDNENSAPEASGISEEDENEEDMNSLFDHHCVNHEGKVKLVCDHKGILPEILLPVKQVYERFNASSIDDIDDARFAYFVNKVFPKVKDSIQGGIMLYISSYLDFVRIRNFLKSQNAAFCLLGEYTKQSDISRARAWFFQGNRKIMLYTERAHFYHRYKIRGVQKLFIYSLPERKDFYSEMLNMIGESKNMMCNVLFSRFDLLSLERIVGTTAAKRMLSSKRDMFVFC